MSNVLELTLGCLTAGHSNKKLVLTFDNLYVMNNKCSFTIYIVRCGGRFKCFFAFFLRIGERKSRGAATQERKG